MALMRVTRIAWFSMVCVFVPILTVWLYFTTPDGSRYSVPSWESITDHIGPQIPEPPGTLPIAKADHHNNKPAAKAPSKLPLTFDSTQTIPHAPAKPAMTQPIVTGPDFELLEEQVWSDFPGNYTNQNNWFEEPTINAYVDNLELLTKDEKAMLPNFQKEAWGTIRRNDKIRSLYNVNGTKRSWQDHIEKLDDEGLAPLTKWAQNYVYKHQHPKSCKGKKFYVLKNRWRHHGLGALVRRVMTELTLAVNADYILVFSTSKAPGDTLVDGNCDPRRGRASLQCVLDDITSCEAYVTDENSVWELPEDAFRGGKERGEYPPVVEASIQSYMKETHLRPTGTFLRYWWRSQMYAYIMRPRPAALARMLEMRMNTTMHTGSALERGATTKVVDVPVPFPLPPATVSIHIRHGDKGGEGRLISTRDYIVTAERFLHRNPLQFVKRAFVSTEDPLVIPELLSTPYVNPSTSFGNEDWLWYYSNIPRVNAGPQKNLQSAGNKTEGLLTHMMQLWMALECDTYVGNRNSNWNKMIDALRCTLLDKCQFPYLEAGFVTDWEYYP